MDPDKGLREAPGGSQSPGAQWGLRFIWSEPQLAVLHADAFKAPEATHYLRDFAGGLALSGKLGGIFAEMDLDVKTCEE